MEKDSIKMITTFKIFETMSEATTPTYLMTLSEYKEKVSPILKSFRKFLSKNTDYLRPANYSGIFHNTYDEYEAKAKARNEKSYPDSWNTWGKKYVEERWPNHKPAPKEVMDTYQDYIKTFSKIFGESNLSKIDQDETNSNKRSVRRALDDETYLNLIKDGKLEYSKFEEILKSVGLKVPAGFNKKINYVPKPTEKSPEEILKIYTSITKCLSALNDRKASVYDIGPRMTKNMYRISYQDIYSFKFIVDNYNFLTFEQKSTLESIPDFKKYIDRAKTYIIKAGEKNITFADSPVYIKIIKEVKEAVQPAIDSYKEEIKKKLLKKQVDIINEKSTMSVTDFEKKYGNEYIDSKNNIRISMNSFNMTELGQLLIMDETETNKYIKDQQDDYQEMEYNKIQTLFYRLQTGFPQIIDFKFKDFSWDIKGLEFIINGYDSNDVIYFINTQGISAGGWNIQRWHMRWLMSVWIGNEKISSYKSE